MISIEKHSWYIFHL